jgi:hypothetical protein
MGIGANKHLLTTKGDELNVKILARGGLHRLSIYTTPLWPLELMNG